MRAEARNISGGRFRPENCRLIRTLTSGSQGSCSSAVSQGVISVCNRAAAVRFVIVNLFSKSHLDCGGVGSDADELSRCEAGRARRALCFQATARALLCKLPHRGWRTVWLKSGTHLNDRLFRYRLRALLSQSLSVRMSGFGTKRASRRAQPMSAFGGKPDIGSLSSDAGS